MTKPNDDPTLACPFCGKLPEEYVVLPTIRGGIKMAACRNVRCLMCDVEINRVLWQRRAGCGSKGRNRNEHQT